ncbi:uncharacterized protein PAC_03712 [Phialocephala subalpina]|uniref:Lipid binding protein TFS1 n=1 Tax=Phialocephala subalpina TaxID=576137 RepID=A0A1L7WM50_9HELO|nr:uncharacterized protein PAC_03712 [Phialocephala subalpina]
MQLSISKIVLLLTLSSACTGLAIPADQKTLAESNGAFESIKIALKKAEIIDQVISDFEPKCFVSAFYGKKQKPLALGNTFKKSKTNKKPNAKIYRPNAQSMTSFTLALTDPDAPSRKNPKWSEMSFNETNSGLESTLDFTSDTKSDLVEYKPPGPPEKTGYHRYVFVLLEGDNTNLAAPSDRQHWGTKKERHGARDWAEQEGLKVVGANFFEERCRYAFKKSTAM